jgi:type III secretion protein D
MELRILSGLHRGAVLDLVEDAGTLAVGMSPQADVLMVDAGVAGIHCRLSSKAGRWYIEPAEGRVFDAAGQLVKASVAIERGASYRIGDVWIGFHAEGDPWDQAVPPAAAARAQQADRTVASRYPRMKASSAGAMLAFVLLPAAVWFVSSAWGRVEPRVAAAKPGVSQSAQSAIQLAASAAASSVPEPAAGLAEEFTHALAERNLTDRLDLELSASRWNIRGSLDAEEQQRLERLLVHFTEKHQPDFPINVTLVSPADLLPFKVVEVISGKGAGIVTDGGDRVYVGDTVQGYRLSAVDPGKVVFVGKRRVEVAL